MAVTRIYDNDPEWEARQERKAAIAKRNKLNMLHSFVNVAASFGIAFIASGTLHLILSIALWISILYVFFIIWKLWPTREVNQ